MRTEYEHLLVFRYGQTPHDGTGIRKLLAIGRPPQTRIVAYIYLGICRRPQSSGFARIRDEGIDMPRGQPSRTHLPIARVVVALPDVSIDDRVNIFIRTR